LDIEISWIYIFNKVALKRVAISEERLESQLLRQLAKRAQERASHERRIKNIYIEIIAIKEEEEQDESEGASGSEREGRAGACRGEGVGGVAKRSAR
jgi:hypothetical protein